MICCHISLNLYAKAERDMLVYNYIQLQVVNLTNIDIKFYFNELNYGAVLPYNMRKFVTRNSPVNNEYPGFIAIDRGDGNLEIYKKGPIYNEVTVQIYYAVLIYNDKVEIFEIDKVDRYYEEIDKEPWKLNREWDKYEINDKIILIEIENQSNRLVTISPNEFRFGGIQSIGFENFLSIYGIRKK